MNEQFINELATALRKVGTIHTVGEEWVSYIGEIPNGGIPYCGQEVTRTTYSALWGYAQEKGLVKTEAEWQQIATANGGNVPYYSNGNGSSTFRMPKLVGYIRGASSQSEAGEYVAEGLPTHTHTRGTMNITGAISAYWKGANPIWNGDNAFYTASGEGEYTSAYTDTFNNDLQKFDASRSWTGETSEPSNSIYGNSSHVTPETSVVLFGVYAFGVVTNAGELDVSAIARDVSDAKMGLNGVVRSVNGLTADANGEVSVVIPPAYVLPTATSSVIGGVKVGSNITNTDGKISLSKSNVTTALGYTPVKSVNGSTVDANGNVEIAVGGKTLIGTIVTPTSNFGSNTQTFNLPIGTHIFLRVYQNGVAGTPQGGTLTVNPCVNHGRLISATNTSDLTATKSQNASVSLYLAPNSSGSGMHYWDLHFVTCSTSVAITMKNGTGTMARTVEVYA